MLRDPDHVVIVGGSLAGVSVAERLRDAGSMARITIVDAEPGLPYDRPPLSKAQLEAERGFRPLRDAEWFESRNIVHVTGVEALGLDPIRPEVALSDGRAIAGDAVVIATGSTPRRIGAWAAVDEVCHLRTFADAERLRLALESAESAVIIGAGFIGLEVAAAAAKWGCRVTVLEAAPSPLARVLPAELGRLLVGEYAERGVDLRFGVQVRDVTGSSADGLTVHTDGADLEADVVVSAVGSVPVTDWLAGSGLRIEDGVVCDGSGFTGRAGVWAAGDVARWPNAVTGRHGRVEQWQAARDQGALVAQALLGDGRSWAAAPYFWSDLFSTKIQFLGHADPGYRRHLLRAGTRGICLLGDDRLRGVLVLNSPRWAALLKPVVEEVASFERGVAVAEELAGMALAGGVAS